jgi:esterase/lipase superfamily enzyme
MLDALAPLVDAGRLKLYCPESNVAEAWTRRDHDAAWRIQRHVAYERFVLDTLVPRIRADCRSPALPLAVAGCSLGAFYAANLALKHPATFRWALCMSGRYAMTHFTDGFSNGDVYFNNPIAYVGSLEGEPLEQIRRHTHVVLTCGQGMWEEGCIDETRSLAGLLAAKQIPHELDLWGHDVAHDWSWWRRQASHHLGRRFGGG